MTLGGFLHLAGALAATLGALALALHVLRRLQGARPAGLGPRLRVLQRVEVGPKSRVALVQVGERVLVLGVADSALQLLGELEAEASLEALRAAREDAPAARFGRFAAPPAGGAPAARLPGTARALLARFGLLALLLAFVPAGGAFAQTSPPPAATGAPRLQSSVSAPPAPLVVRGPVAPQVDISFGRAGDQLHLSGAVGLVVFLGFLTLLPAIVLLMTSFTRILIVLHFLRSALGTQSAPPGQLLTAIAILLTAVVMNPVMQQVNHEAIQPYTQGRITQVEAYEKGIVPFREFMLANTREQDLAMFAEVSGADTASDPEHLPILTLVSSFVTSELRTAFQMGFAVYLPFVVIDVIVASVLMSLGMFMLPPVMISLPFKLLLFVLADGWSLVFESLIKSFR